MELSPLDLGIGLALSTVVAGAAFLKNSLSSSGFLAAMILGTMIFALGGWLYWAILILFFISSSLLSKFKHQHKAHVEADFAKTGRRDWLQVLANGAVGLGLVSAWWFSGNHLFSVGYIAAFATVNADTWATEVGVLSKNPPVSILNLKPTAPGVSGAVSLLGSSAALAGAGLISVSAAYGLFLNYPGSVDLLPIIIASTSGGVFGCLVDSILGATVQAMYKCNVCGRLSEKTRHHNQPTERVRGLKFFNNDMVNFTSSMLGSILAMALFKLLT